MSEFNIYLRSKTLNPSKNQKEEEKDNTCYKKRRELANS
jgi:hypothetical protein